MMTLTCRKMRVGGTLLAIAMGVTGASAQDAAAPAPRVPTGTLTIAWPWDPGTMDPQMHRQRYTQIVSVAMRDKLFVPTPPTMERLPMLAVSLTQVDDTHYDVKLREGVHFHNGDELTADDVVYTFQRLWDPATKSPRAKMGNMTNVEKIEALDRYTVRWTTKVPFGPPEEAILGLHVVSQEILNKATYEKLTMAQAAAGNVVGAGPFKLAEWIPDQRVVMDAFEDYWQGPPGVAHIIWRTIPEEATRTAELLAGSVDVIYPVTPDSVPQLKSAGMKLEIVPGTSTRMLMMNVREGSPFHDVEVRKAMNMAIDKLAITENIYQGLANPFEQVSGVGQQGFIEGYDPFPYDPEAARAILSKITQPVELVTQPMFELAAEAIAEQLRGYGMKVTAVVLDNAAATKANDEGDFDLLLASSGYGDGGFAGAYYNNNFECSRLETNRIRTGFCDPGLDEKIAAARAEPDAGVKEEKVAEVNKLLSEEFVPWVPLFGEAEVAAMQPYVNGFVVTSSGQFYALNQVTLDR
jgi:peptide/nickel transport system substrate-binding protein